MHTLRSYYALVKAIFKHCCATGGSGDINVVGWNSFTDFLNAAGVGDNKNCGRAALDMTFIGAAMIGQKLTKGNADYRRRNPKKLLCRFQFFDALVKLALVKYSDIGPAQAIDKFMRRHLEIYAQQERLMYYTYDWRADRLHNIECELVLREHKGFMQVWSIGIHSLICDCCHKWNMLLRLA